MSIRTAIEALRPDPWRASTPFSPDLEPWHRRILAAGSDEEAAQALADWIGSHQPCLFGRLAAKSSAITFCILREEDLNKDDEAIRDKIQARRLEWSREAFRGRTSAFVLVATSRRIAEARPDERLATLARRLCFLYLRQEIEMDKIYTDEIALEFPGESRITRTWAAGVNFFSSQGDGRWWRDHRFPAGLAFSVNSVGHLVRSGRVNNALSAISDELDYELPKGYRIDTLTEALAFAMRTIAMAQPTPSGRATELLPVSDAPALECPVTLPPQLRDKSHCEYLGRYHTDITLPSEYFRPDVDRPGELPEHRLDFTYLFDRNIENSDFDLLGEGRRIRADSGETGVEREPVKRRQSEERVVLIDDTVLLKEALTERPNPTMP